MSRACVRLYVHTSAWYWMGFVSDDVYCVCMCESITFSMIMKHCGTRYAKQIHRFFSKDFSLWTEHFFPSWCLTHISLSFFFLFPFCLVSEFDVYTKKAKNELVNFYLFCGSHKCNSIFGILCCGTRRIQENISKWAIVMQTPMNEHGGYVRDIGSINYVYRQLQ